MYAHVRGRSRGWRGRATAVAMAIALTPAALLGGLPAGAAPDDEGSVGGEGVAFEPAPASQPIYGTAPPSADPDRQIAVIEAADGVDLFVETWLPAPRGDAVPPARVPTVLLMSPYKAFEVLDPVLGPIRLPEVFTSRGYAFAFHHVRGTGASGGCLEQTAAMQTDDGARVVHHLGTQAPWSDGTVGMYGASYDAETQLSVAGLGDPALIAPLKAIVPVASVGGQYEFSHLDGVPFTTWYAQSTALYLALSALPAQQTSAQHIVEKAACQPEVAAPIADTSGDLTPFWAVRELRPGAERIRAATLYVHGTADQTVLPVTLAGWYDRLPADTPHRAVIGAWDHAFPGAHPSVNPDLQRADWIPMVIAWFDRYLKGIDTGVESWPEVQVQSSDGRWRVEPDFPTTGGPRGSLALGPAGVLGAVRPTGTTGYIEQLDVRLTGPANGAVFQTRVLDGPLHLTGQPVLDLWLTTDRPDGHVTAVLEVIGPDGQPQVHAGSDAVPVMTVGARSLRHLDPLLDGRFAQRSGRPAPTGTPIRVEVRLQPTDLVVAEGGRLRLTVSGATAFGVRELMPSGVAARIQLLHDCTHQSTLRFELATPGAPLLDVREIGEDGPLDASPGVQPLHDGAGLATRPTCGRWDVPPDEIGWR